MILKTLFLYFNAKLIKHNILSRNVFFKFFGGIRGFSILTRDLEKRRKVVVHHTLTGGSMVTDLLVHPSPQILDLPRWREIF